MKGQLPQQCFLTPLLIGTDGSQKMSKSLGNYIGITEPPNEIYGKVMSISDSLILHYFELVTDVPDEELEEFRQELSRKTVNPMTLKKRLAREIVTQLYSQKAATEAEENFVRVVQEKELPDKIEDLPLNLYFKDLSPEQMEFTSVDISKLLVVTGKVKSRSEANRLIEQGAVSIDGKKLTGPAAHIKIGSIIKVGKRRFARVINTDIIT
jgi:tyrosyl-tRNA synthetase